MRPVLATSVGRVPLPSSSARVRHCFAFHHRSTPSTSSCRTITTSSRTCLPAVKPSVPRFQAEPWTEKQSSSSSNREGLPPTLARPPRRRSGTSVHSADGEAEGAHISSTTPSHAQSSVDKSRDSNAIPNTRAQESKVTTAKTPLAESSVARQSDSQGRTDQTSSKIAPSDVVDTAPTKARRTISERVKGLWENIKYLFRFYYNGVKQIWSDRQLVAEMKTQIAQRQASGQGEMYWREKATIELHGADVRKLPLFLAILIILEEILPLVVIYAPSLLPSTCILPSQSLKMRAEEERRRGLAIQRLASDAGVRQLVERVVNRSCAEKGLESSASKSGPEGDVAQSSKEIQGLSDFSSPVLRDVAAVFGLRGWGPQSLVRSRIESHLRFLRQDDELLQRAWSERGKSTDKDGQHVDEWNAICHSGWLWRASGKRGLRSSAADEGTMERTLQAYLHLTHECSKEQEDEHVQTLHRALIPLALYDGTANQLRHLQMSAEEEHSKGLRKRTKEVVQSVVQEAKRNENR